MSVQRHRPNNGTNRSFALTADAALDHWIRCQPNAPRLRQRRFIVEDARNVATAVMLTNAGRVRRYQRESATRRRSSCALASPSGARSRRSSSSWPDVCVRHLPKAPRSPPCMHGVQHYPHARLRGNRHLWRNR